MKKIRNLTAVLAGLAALGAASTASASLLAIENFEYDVGTGLSGQNGGTGWPDAWGGTWSSTGGSSTIGSGPLVYPGHFASSGNRAVIDASSGTVATPRALPAGIDTTSGSLYFSYLTRRTADTERTLNFSFAVGGNERFAFGQINDTGGNFGVFAHNNMTGTGSGTVFADDPIAFELNEVYLIMGRIEFGFDGDNDRVSLFVNPTPGESESNLTPYMQWDQYDLGDIDRFRVFAGGATDLAASGGEFDQIRFGTSFDAVVVPEPSTYAAIFGALALAFAVYRRRMRR